MVSVNMYIVIFDSLSVAYVQLLLKTLRAIITQLLRLFLVLFTIILFYVLSQDCLISILKSIV